MLNFLNIYVFEVKLIQLYLHVRVRITLLEFTIHFH